MIGNERRRLVRTVELMGTVASVHVVADAAASTRQTSSAGLIRADVGARVEQAIAACFAELVEIERVFSTFIPDSDISRLQRDDLRLSDADARVSVVHEACLRAREATHGRFDAWYDGRFDPTGYVKGWATQGAARRHLEPLTALPGVAAAGIGVGGDMQLFTATDTAFRWKVGVADPIRPGRVSATLVLRDGAVATSGIAERGAHIVDPSCGAPSVSVASATVVADELEMADLWATAAVVAGFDDLSWIRRANVRSGLLLAPDGRTRRWSGGVEITRYPTLGVGDLLEAA